MRKDKKGNLCVEDEFDIAENEFWMGINDRRNDKVAVTRNFAAIVEQLRKGVEKAYGLEDGYANTLYNLSMNLLRLAEALSIRSDYDGVLWKYKSDID